ncbi:MAG: squalene--hopene cyclase [Firmicutes bacterium]|nr:squalene--hopene cyclase [Alicyclobacillaceae bacterium]MCL6498072.1 squalene--hopene cyclase [Bacillota bacterium]
MGLLATGPALTRTAVESAVAHLLQRQREDGSWWGLLASNVCMEAEYVLLAHCLDRRDPTREAQIARHLLHNQTPEGAWVLYAGGPGDLNATVEAYQALKLIGYDPEAEPMQKARAFIRQHGGINQTRVFTRVWLALVGQYPWDYLPILPPELVFFPNWAPLNLYDFASWARPTVVALSLVMAHRPVFPLPPGKDVQELYTEPPARVLTNQEGGRFWTLLDQFLHHYHHWAPAGIRRRAEALALDWLLARQEADGSWGGIQPPWFYALLALKTLGMTDHPAFERGWQGLEGFGVNTADGRWWLQACVSPTWDTALAVLALREAGCGPDHEALVKAGRWLINQQVLKGGDWQVRRPRVEPGGWPFEFVNDNYPDVDDTAVVLMALQQLKLPDEEARRRALTRGFRWMVAMQSRAGGWGAFDADNTRPFPRRIPFSDFGWVTDPPTEDVTGHVLECLGGFGYDEAWPVVARAVEFLRRLQRPEGPWFGRWGVNYLYGTGAVLPGLKAVGVDLSQPWVQRALDWVEQRQNPDGGWGEDPISYRDPTRAGMGPSTPSQTAWALLALIAGGRADSPAARRGVTYLVHAQRPDGGWHEEAYTGTGFPGDFYIQYEMYRVVFPLLALARYEKAQGGR